MKQTSKKWFSLVCLAILLVPMCSIFLGTWRTPASALHGSANQNHLADDGIAGELIPLRRAAFVAPNPLSYIDDFSYMAAIPTSVFLHNDAQYISPLIYSVGSDSETWLVDDWIEYLGMAESLTQAISIGEFSDAYLQNLQNQIGTRIFPRITGDSSAEIAAQLAMMDWTSTNSAVIALAKDSFPGLSTTSGSASHTFDSPSVAPFSTIATVLHGPITNVTFTPPAEAGWMDGSFDWVGTELLTHVLYDPSGTPVDYSVQNQVVFERNLNYVDELVPLHFWYPVAQNGVWTMALDRLDPGTTSVTGSIVYHPGFSQTVDIPVNAKWLNVTATWDNSGTDLNFALIDPEGRLVTWAPAESLIAGLLTETMRVPYPMSGEWTIIAAWMNPESEQNHLELMWDVSSMPDNLAPYLESAANGAVLASLLNVPLLYADVDELPQITSFALSRLGVDNILLVDPLDMHSANLATELAGLASSVTTLDSYPLVTQAIQAASGQSDVVLTTPTGTGNEFFPSAAYSGAFHGAPVFSLCGNDNLLTTRAEETWAPYFIGPQIDIFVEDRWTSRTETGWYDERIPNRYSMLNTTGVFEQFLSTRGAYNSSHSQQAVILSPVDLIKASFDRSLHSHFRPGRIPAPNGALASIFVNRAALHRFLYLTAESADEALMSLYAYTDGAGFVDNFFNSYGLNQIEDTQNALETTGFTTLMHVGVNEVFDALASQVAFWAFSTHGTLSNGPRDPPKRPDGLGYFSMRDLDAIYGFESSVAVRDQNNDHLVNPVLFESEYAHHILQSTDDLEAAIGNIGSPIITLTACLLGGTGLPLMLMEHGAVGVTAAPRTVYFQPAGMLSILIAQALCEGNSTGDALSNGHRLISSDFTDPLVGRDPRDYANQQILFGDPSIKLYLPASDLRIPALDPLSSSFDGHTPGSGTPDVVGLGVDDTLPSILASLGADFEYYSPTNFTLFDYIYPLVSTVLVAPEEFETFSPLFESASHDVEEYVRFGGTLVVLGVNGDTSWLPWPLSIDGSSSGTSITITDSSHPLLLSPNTLDAAVSYQGVLRTVWSNLTVLATDGSTPVIAAGVIGSGKLALTTTTPVGLDLNTTVENAISWGAGPSLTLHSIQTNQFIIWEGDRVVVTIDITNRVGVGVAGVTLGVSINDTAVAVVEVGSGVYTVTLDEAWTSGQVGTFDLWVSGQKAGYDSLSILLTGFLTIRQLPLLGLAILGGFVAAVGLGAYAIKRKRGGGNSTSRKRGESKEDYERRKEKDERFDAKEFFGV